MYRKRRKIYESNWGAMGARYSGGGKRPERVAAVGERRSRTVGKESTGHRNRDCQKSGGIWYNRTKVVATRTNTEFFVFFVFLNLHKKHIHSKSEMKITSLLL